MKRSELLVLAVALVASIATPGTLLAQYEPQPAGEQPAPTVSTSTMTGALVSSSADSLVIRTDAGVESTFTVDSGTIMPASLTPGDRVSVAYHMLDGGAYHASRVTALAEGESDPTATSGFDDTTPAAPGGAPEGATQAGAANRAGAGGDLPRTAGPLPLFAVMGVLAIVAAFGVRAIFRRMRANP